MEVVRKMMGFSGLCLVFIVIMMLGMEMEGVMGFKEFSVGGRTGWHVPDSNQTDFYDQWAQSKRFHVGDSLRFQYQNDSVLVVDKFGFYHCDPSKATSTYNDGNTVINLEKPGLIYFISGSPDNCRNGERIEVDVMSPHTSPAPESKDEAHSPTSSSKSGSSIHMAKISELLEIVAFASVLLL